MNPIADIREAMTSLVRNLDRFNPLSIRIQLGRSLIALAQLTILTLTTWPNLTADIVGRSPEGYCDGSLRQLSMFCLGGPVPQQVGIWIGVAIALLVVIGLVPRYVAPLHAWMAISLNASLALPDGGEAIASFATVILIVVCLPDNRVLAWVRPRRPISSRLGAASYAASIALCIQMAGVYFESGLAKIAVSEWLDGSAMYFIVRDPYFGSTGLVGIVLRAFTDVPLGSALLTWGTIVVECSIAVLFLLPSHCKQYALFGVVILHIGIAIALGLWSFSAIMIGTAFVAAYRLEPAPDSGDIENVDDAAAAEGIATNKNALSS